MTNHLTDAELISISIDTPEQFGGVFDRHYEAIRRFAWRRLGSGPADDIAAEVFARAFDARARFDHSVDDARPWLFGIATNLMRMHARSERRKLRAYARSGIDPHEDFAPAATDRAYADGERRDLLRALAGLKRRDREIVLLYAWGELSTGEIALALGIPAATVRTKLARSRDRLAGELIKLAPPENEAAPDVAKENC
jgi:RNA polymerase sigma factor (sigma-70 family)